MVPAASSGAVSGSSSSLSVPSPVTSGPSGSSVGRFAFPVIQWAPYTARESEGVPEPVVQWDEFESVQKNVINFCLPPRGVGKICHKVRVIVNIIPLYRARVRRDSKLVLVSRLSSSNVNKSKVQWVRKKVGK